MRTIDPIPTEPTTTAEDDGVRVSHGPASPVSTRGIVAFLLAACGVALAYTLYTGHIWEDYFITFRHSQNLVEGHGLVFSPGERVHGFTSPLGVLLPALCHLVAGGGSYEPALWLFRLLSIAAYAGAGALLLRSLCAQGARRGAEGLFFGLLYLLHVTLVDNTINGMETAFMALFLAWGLSLAATGLPERWAATGLCWGALMWARPDSVIYIAALAAIALAFPRAPRRVLLGSMLKSAAVCSAVYVPWFAWAWWYYGSPVPHTIIAKSMVGAGPIAQLKFLVRGLLDRSLPAAVGCFQPSYYHLGRDWHPGLVLASNALGIFGALYWMMPVRDRLGRMASLGFAMLCLYLAIIPHLYPWYLPPAAMLGLFVAVRGSSTLADELRPRVPRSRAVVAALLCALCAERAVFFGLTAFQMRVQQQEIETGTRMQVGLWLKDHVRPGERVYLEPIGYIGYFSGARLADWPGLATPEVVRLRKQEGRDYVTLLPRLNPEWLVLRPGEVEQMSQSEYFREHYAPVATFDARPRLDRHGRIPGRGYLDYDSAFLIYSRTGPDRS